MIDTMLLFGATGDLAGRLLLPALASLHSVGSLSAGFRIIATARQQWDDAGFRRHAAQRLEQHAAGVPAVSREALVHATSYRYSDVTVAGTVSAVVREATGADGRPIAAYLALPQGLFAPTVTTLGDVGLPRGSRIVLEKPFGETLDDAIALNRLLAKVVGDAGGQAVYRVDHALGMVTVQNLIGLRFASRMLEAIWTSDAIEQIDILWEETLADSGGADGRQVPDYVDEAGVDPARGAETFAEVVLAVDNDRWTGTRFVLRTGKALAERRKEVVVHFRPDSGPPFRPGRDQGAGVTSDVLRIGVDGPMDIVLRLNGTAGASPEEVTTFTLASPPVTSTLPPYG
jgi:glucose-6-phosphate 1-dehydrogenase